jgi:hypothetical protein
VAPADCCSCKFRSGTVFSSNHKIYRRALSFFVRGGKLSLCSRVSSDLSFFLCDRIGMVNVVPTIFSNTLSTCPKSKNLPSTISAESTLLLSTVLESRSKAINLFKSGRVPCTIRPSTVIKIFNKNNVVSRQFRLYKTGSRGTVSHPSSY